ncbi:MAG: tagaturonate reductase [Muribaculum sp.]|nr:tagaturonate reductase [Muribaculaceae bacterium]MCM1081284.1 tagaturonate reductase [Muribaculum sp.]
MANELNRTTAGIAASSRPLKVLQFGEGNFLRAFVDWMLQIANEKGYVDSSVAVVSPRFSENNSIKKLQAQQGLYNVVLEGIRDNKPICETKLVDVITEAFSPATDINRYVEIIESDDLRFIISNTTEAGISYMPDRNCTLMSQSFPAKITALLHRRFMHFNGDKSKGLIFICCELIEDNGTTLKKYVKRHAEENNFGSDFINWIDNACIFADTLVDRIVPGFPSDDAEAVAEQIGFNDKLMVKGELYHVWAIGGDGWETIQKELPLDKAGLNVLFMPSVKEFREKKVRILNGSHTAMAVIGLQLGISTVMDAFDNKQLNRFITGMVNNEVIPTIEGDKAELRLFANGILERFYNPYIKHYLKNIALNSLSKWEARNFPVVADYCRKFGIFPQHELFSFAALIKLYSPGSGFTPDDNAAHIATIANAWNEGTDSTDIIKRIIHGGVFSIDFETAAPGFIAAAAKHLDSIRKNGIALS